VTLVTDHKISYDADDMKVVVDGGRLVRIGKDLAPEKVNGESIGMLLFRGEGPTLFRIAMEKALNDPSARKKWYLSVIDQMAQSMPIWTCSVQGLRWAEVDYPADLKQAQQVVEACANTREFVAAASPGWRVPRYGQFPVPLPHLK
jgi:choline kinase